MNNPIRYILYDKVSDVSSWLKYEVLHFTPPTMPLIDTTLSLKLHKEKGGGYWTTCENYPGLIASGDTFEELRESLFDAILLYFQVPRYLTKKVPDKLILNLPDGTQILPKDPLLGSINIQLSVSN